MVKMRADCFITAAGCAAMAYPSERDHGGKSDDCCSGLGGPGCRTRLAFLS